jgi:hypothetical protein
MDLVAVNVGLLCNPAARTEPLQQCAKYCGTGGNFLRRNFDLLLHGAAELPRMPWRSIALTTSSRMLLGTIWNALCLAANAPDPDSLGLWKYGWVLGV